MCWAPTVTPWSPCKTCTGAAPCPISSRCPAPVIPSNGHPLFPGKPSSPGTRPTRPPALHASPNSPTVTYNDFIFSASYGQGTVHTKIPNFFPLILFFLLNEISTAIPWLMKYVTATHRYGCSNLTRLATTSPFPGFYVLIFCPSSCSLFLFHSETRSSMKL